MANVALIRLFPCVYSEVGPLTCNGCEGSLFDKKIAVNGGETGTVGGTYCIFNTICKLTLQVDGNSGIAMERGHASGSGNGEEIAKRSQRLKGVRHLQCPESNPIAFVNGNYCCQNESGVGCQNCRDWTTFVLCTNAGELCAKGLSRCRSRCKAGFPNYEDCISNCEDECKKHSR